jgi:hypothetical protein
MPLTSRRRVNRHASDKQTTLQPAERVNRESALGCSDTETEQTEILELNVNMGAAGCHGGRACWDLPPHRKSAVL